MVLEPISAAQLRARLNEGTVQFAFKKLDGNLRIALGTTNLELIPTHAHPNGRGGTTRKVSYFDLQKNEWRAVSETQNIFLPE